MHSLPIFVRLRGAEVLVIGTGTAAEAKARLAERAGASVVSLAPAALADYHGTARLAFIALDDSAADDVAALAALLRGKGMLVNVADQPDLCDFTLPAIVDRDPVVIAIGTGGASAGLAKELRLRLEALLPATLGGLAQALAAARGRMRACFPDARQRRLAIDAALAPGGVLDPLSGAGESAVAHWLDDDGAAASAGALETLYFASADPEDMTLRAARLLGRADEIWHRGDVPNAILDRARADASRHIAPSPPAGPHAGLRLWLEMAR